MIEILKTKEQLKKELNSFVWEFKISDNIEYNLDVLFNLIEDNDHAKDYKKPISLIAVSIIEAIMIDFLYRLYQGTSHFPQKLKDKETVIKSKLTQETKKSKYVDSENREYWVCSLKNFDFITMIKIYQDLKLLGDYKQNYEFLMNLARFRNRIHIKNYFNNFEKDESKTFSESRVEKIIKAMVWFFGYFQTHYPRPWSTVVF
ncbi:MAG: hypothetical protein A2469_04435 [Candidatus Magasanikbacteria bacterium RIFOXYC2_FULL_40_16]|uniref:Uncharacterized protein n=3 Tax=Candidatus Magasanikiibacteriota TaxID=1752731 RepID=A0A1F6NEF1_9BACT|nr:MAG: hypothetical protein A2224_03790 [Candidatus Magasanikbacteria bacterium RIFOXYA2_FULL_40_20]OGH82317.1 MAG: hypothetical protein A2373_02365 [Candidatus Magasanikbacteria bacterium RIFOXYB1_FULL_40_15]OGH86376.1 MAG: hypothetical protein A2301_00450 [Candidatus Magasanikbacteria bacterium RIFOXYB2_FULL_40_13]OGH87410.1 MAG: hypothetical protein A2206_01775 [Candidatus Magasanikbacteria bacterium RIFOXYA1_FULL_40_8]OGH89418.1 MAG: hypothetical protein A2469_04435 [Candidatus Magasanikba